MLYNVPIESLEERYSMQWNKWFPEEFQRYRIEWRTIYPKPLTDKIEQGAFLDICGTNYFKAAQLQEIALALHNGMVKDGDIFFFHDLWFPGLEMLAYMRDALHIDFKIYGILHAGTWDEHDFLFREGMHYWAKDLENSWFRIIDGVFLATGFHRNLISQRRRVRFIKLHVTGLPIYPKDLPLKNLKKENWIVFPHRLDPEKRPDEFDKITETLSCEDAFKNWEFIKTKEICEDKQHYYDILSQSKIALSFAEQETWGIAMQEAVFAGCVPLVPNRLSYQGLYPSDFRYSDLHDLVARIRFLVTEGWESFDIVCEATRSSFQLSGETAISNMLNIMRLI